MPPDRFGPNDPREWLRRADSNLVQAQRSAPGICLEDLCFQAQQAAEKAVKALLIARGQRPPHTHSLTVLFDLLRQGGVDVPEETMRTVRLNDYAVETRYPGLFEPVAEEDYREALDLALRCVEWVRQALAGPGAHEA